mgnify:CR=1 FL=1
MKMIHSMRLKGPWHYAWLFPELSAEELGCPLSGTVKIPTAWEKCFGKIPGVVQWSRRFQKPTNLDVTERVMISAPTLPGVRAVRINQALLPLDGQPAEGFRFDITEALEPANNLLQIEMTCDSESEVPDRGMTEPAMIEIWSLTE